MDSLQEPFRTTQTQQSERLMLSVSVVIPNLNSPIIHLTIDSLIKQDYCGSYDITVVGQDRFGLIQENDLVRSIHTPKPVIQSIARNIGIRETKGEILAFIDADCVASPQWLSRLVRHYDEPNTSVLGGGVTFPNDNYWILSDNVATFHEYMTTTRPGIRQQLPTVNLSIRRSILENVGLFDESLPIGEDADLTSRLSLNGHRLLFDPHACVTHLPQRCTLSSILHHAYNFGQHSIKVDRRYQDELNSPFILRQWWTILLLAPFLSAGVLYHIVTKDRIPLKYWVTFPTIYLTKLVWCIGAAKRLK